jgi:hypothetical protein
MRGEGRHVCCEQIRLVVGGDAGRRAAGAVIPLLVPDLPVFLWCAGTPPWENEFFRRLLDVADRLIVDSRTFPDPAAGLEDLVERRGEEWSPADLDWYRHESWREAIAVCFDDPRLARRAGDVDRIGVGYGTASEAAPGAIPSAAALLAGWALDRVELAREAGPTGLAARVEAGDAAGEATPPEVVLERMTDAPSGEIARAHLSVSSESISFRIECPGEGEVLTLDANTPHAGSHRHRLPRVRLPLERLLARALDDASPDVVYERALLRAASILSGTSPD